MSRRGGMGAHHSATVGSDDWITPEHVLTALGAPFDLDPCQSLAQPWPTAKKGYTVHDNGLQQPWEGEVWLNPPYSDATPWLARLADHGHGVALIFARTDTQMWFDHIWDGADAIVFLQGRLSFSLPNGMVLANSGAPSVLIAYGYASRWRLVKRNESLLPGHLIYL